MMLDMQKGPVGILVARNLMLIVTFGVTAWRLGKMAGDGPSEDQ